MTTIPPMRMIVEAIVGADNVVGLVPPGASPHAFELRPSHARAVQDARALIYVADNLDGWARDLPASEQVQVTEYIRDELVLEDSHGDHSHGANPHFWSDPILVEHMLPLLSVFLTNADRARLTEYQQNFEAFRDELRALDKEIQTLLAPCQGRSVIVMHPSWDYFFHRYGIKVAGVLEPTPGHEPSPKHIEALIAVAKEHNVRAVLSEPQLPTASAEVLAKAIGVAVYEIDPLGGLPGRDSYLELVRYNAKILAEALQ